jgi:hypothetical protein
VPQGISADLIATTEGFTREQCDQLGVDSQIRAAAAIAESTTQQLLAQDGGEPRWRTMRTIAVRARNKGIVAHLPAANGAWAETSTLLAEVVDIAQMQFVAQGLQSDLPRLQNDMRARVVPAGAASADASEGTLHIGIEADRSRDFGRRCRTRPTNALERFELFSTQFTRVGISLDTSLDGRVLSRRGEPDPAARLSCHVLGHIFESPACLPYAG